MKYRNKIILVGLVGASLAGGTAAAVAAIEDSSPSAPPTSAGGLPVTAPTGSAALTARISAFPPAQPAPLNAALVSPVSLVAAAKLDGTDLSTGQRITSADLSNVRSAVVQTTYAQYESKLGEHPDPVIDPSRPVYAVVIYAGAEIEAPPNLQSRSVHVYTNLYDAVSGDLIERDLGTDYTTP